MPAFPRSAASKIEAAPCPGIDIAPAPAWRRRANGGGPARCRRRPGCAHDRARGSPAGPLRDGAGHQQRRGQELAGHGAVPLVQQPGAQGGALQGAEHEQQRPGGARPGRGGAMGEIGSAQYFQSLAARAAPEVRMNPLLLKPETDTRSQVVLLGQVHADLGALPWRGRSARVWPQIAAALDALRAQNDVLVIEGAGSPAEINLYASDIVNLRVARHAAARCLLVTDIDRGGAFAHLYGTWALLPEADRRSICGFVL